MSWIDWLIVIVPVAFVYVLSWYSRRFIRGVSDYLAAGRLCGRYVINIGSVANALSIIGLTGYVEMQYKAGFALNFWTNILTPLGIVLSLSGFCIYRFRETKAMSLGQFLEMRYSRKFRIFAAALRSLSEMLANMIMPALAARFFIYLLDLPRTINLFGFQVQTFMVIVILTLIMAISIICMGGTLALVITDTLQGVICYPLMVLFVIFILCTFSWSGEILPVMTDRAAGESFLDPNDIEQLQVFNVFSMVVVAAFVAILHRASWTGAGTESAARSPQEQKMASLLGTWSGSIVTAFQVLIAVTVITLLNHANFADNAHTIRTDLASRVVEEFVDDSNLRQEVMANVKEIPVIKHQIGVDKPLSQTSNIDTVYLENIHNTLLEKMPDQGEANATFQQCRTLFYQLNMALSMRHLLPVGMLGAFCLLMILAMVSTDDTRIYSAALTIAQDVILPLRKKEMTQTQHLRMIRCVTIGVGVFFAFGSYFMAQMDYIQLYVTMVCTMWMGGCGPVMVFGLYSKFGTTAGAWVSLLVGSFMAVLGVVLQNHWAATFYPWIAENGLVEAFDTVFRSCSMPFEPWIHWEMNAVQFPINSFEFYFITMLLTLFLYIVVSFATSKKPFNLERMLHRGKYSLDEKRDLKIKWTVRTVFSNLIGITPEYTKGDRIIAYAIFAYSFVYAFLIMFVLVALWNLISPWPIEWWGTYFLIASVIVPGVTAAVTAVWFTIGGIVDMRQLFIDLKKRKDNPLDDGRVEGNMSLADKAELEAVDRQQA